MPTLPLLTRRISRGIHAYSVKRLCWFLTPPRLQKLVRWPNITLSPTPCASLADINVHAICPSVCVSWVVKIKLASRCDGRAHCLVLSCIPGGTSHTPEAFVLYLSSFTLSRLLQAAGFYPRPCCCMFACARVATRFPPCGAPQ